MFDSEGRFKDSPTFNRPPISSDAFMPGLGQERREEFGSFLKTLMKINPSERVSAMDLLRHPWLDAIVDSSAPNPEQDPESVTETAAETSPEQNPEQNPESTTESIKETNQEQKKPEQEKPE
jgi:serine/threonine protein kinase